MTGDSLSRPAAPIVRTPALDLALFVGAVPVAVGAARIWLYSGGDQQLFLVLLRTIDIPSMLISTAVLLVPALVLVGSLTLVFDVRARRSLYALADRHPRAFPVALAVFGLLVLYTADWLVLAAATVASVVAVAVLLLRRAMRKGARGVFRRSRAVGSASFNWVSIALTAVGVVLVTPSNMWLPLEQLEESDGTTSVGYVLQSTGEWTTMLTSDRQLLVMRTADVADRDACRVEWRGSLASLVQQQVVRGEADC